MKPNIAYWLRQYLYVVAVLCLLLPVVSMAMASREIDAWYARTVFGPALERELGFYATIGRPPAFPDEKGEGTFIDAIEPDGAFARAGFQVGDVPDQRCSICNYDIYTLLEWNRGGYALIDVFRRPPGSRARPDFLTLRVPLLARPGVCQREGVLLAGRKPVVVGGTIPPPTKVRSVPVTFPTRAVETRGTGNWMAEALIDTNGDIRRIWVVREPTLDPPWPELSDAIETSIRQWKYEPLIVRGQRVPVCMTVVTWIDWQ